MHSVHDNGRLFLDHWSNGSPAWSGGPPRRDATMSVLYVKAYFNSTDPERVRVADERCGSGRTQACAIPDGIANAFVGWVRRSRRRRRPATAHRRRRPCLWRPARQRRQSQGTCRFYRQIQITLLIKIRTTIRIDCQMGRRPSSPTREGRRSRRQSSRAFDISNPLVRG